MKKKLSEMTFPERVKYFATGRCTVGEISFIDDGRFITRYVGKIRGHVVTDENGDWKFNTPECALSAAQWHKAAAKDKLEVLEATGTV